MKYDGKGFSEENVENELPTSYREFYCNNTPTSHPTDRISMKHKQLCNIQSTQLCVLLLFITRYLRFCFIFDIEGPHLLINWTKCFNMFQKMKQFESTSVSQCDTITFMQTCPRSGSSGPLTAPKILWCDGARTVIVWKIVQCLMFKFVFVSVTFESPTKLTSVLIQRCQLMLK